MPSSFGERSFQPQTLSPAEVISLLSSDPEYGLAEKAVRTRRKQYGINNTRAEIEVSFSKSFSYRCKGVTNLLFLAAMLLFYLFEQQPVYLIGVFVGFALMFLSAFAESRSAKVLNLPGKYALHSARTVRGGIEKTVDSRELVPGDILLLQKGDLVPADVRILEDNGGLSALETPVSGKKTRSPKNWRSFGSETESVSENMLYAGTILTEGECRAIVCRTGKATLIRLLHAKREDQLPTLLLRVREFSRYLSLAGMTVLCLILLLGAVRGYDLSVLFLQGALIGAGSLCDSVLSLASLAFAKGIKDMEKDKLIVRNPNKVARLAAVDSVMSTKEQVFPPRKIRLDSVYVNGKFLPGTFPEPEVEEVLRLSLLCSAHPASRRPYEQAIYQSLKEANPKVPEERLVPLQTRLDIESNNAGEIVGVLLPSDEKGLQTVIIKGAPEAVLSRCAGYATDGKEYRLTENALHSLLFACKNASRENAYLIAVASGQTRASELRDPDADSRLVFRGFMTFRQSVEGNVVGAIYRCKRAGIEAVVSTADPYYTAVSIGKSAGIIEDESQIISGSEMQAQDDVFPINAPKYALFLEPDRAQWLEVLRLRKASGRTVAYHANKEEELYLLKEADVSVVHVKSGDSVRAGADFLTAETGFPVLADGITDAKNLLFRLRWLTWFSCAGFMTLGVSMLLALALGIGFPFAAGELLLGGVVINTLFALLISLLPIDRKLLGEIPPIKSKKRLSPEHLIPAFYAFGSAFCLLLTFLLTGNPTASLPSFAASQFLFACGMLWKSGAIRKKRFGYAPLWIAFPFVAGFVFACVFVAPIRTWFGLQALTARDWALAVLLPIGWQVLLQGLLFVDPQIRKKLSERKKNTENKTNSQ